jgi:hypothetical protein
MGVTELAATSVQRLAGSSTPALKSAGPQSADSWDAIVSRVTKLTESGLRPSNNPSQQVEQLSGLLRLQVDVSRYQLKVELVSKVSESAVASVRKLQQNQ